VRQVLKFNLKRKAFLSYLENQKGQAVVEYILVLVITISLLMGFKGAFSNVGNFIYSYVGEYTECLMEYGELPSLGVSEQDLQNHKGGTGGGKVCDSKFAGFTFVDGRPSTTTPGSPSSPTPSSPGSTKDSSNNSSNSSKNSSNSASANSSKSSSDSSDSSGAGGGSGAGGRGRSSSPYTTGQISRSGGSGFGTADGGAATNPDKVRVLEGQEGDSAFNRVNDYDVARSRRSGYERDRYKAITGEQAEQIDRRGKTTRGEPISKSITVVDESGRMGPKKSVYTPQERKLSSVENNNEEGFTIGAFFKWLIIAGMLIALLLFFGGQVMNFTNSQEK